MSSVIGRSLPRPVRSSRPFGSIALAIAASVLAPVAVVAQASSAPAVPVAAAPAQPAAPAPVTAGWQDGFFIQSADGHNRIVFGAVVQVDGRFTTDEPSAFVDTFTIRKARSTIQGRVAKYFDFRVTPEFGNGGATVLDAYLDTRFSNAFHVRAGKDKTPVGLEILYGDPGLLFPERSLVSTLLPNRDVGVQIQGDLAGSMVSYALGVFNGVADGSSSTTDVDVNNGKDVAGRILVQPFHTTTPTAFSNFGVHLGASTGHETGALPSFKTSAGQTYFSYNGASADGDRVRVSPAVFYYYKAFGAFAEYARVTQDIAKGAASRNVENDAWNVSATWILTGETASSGVIRPKRAFDPPTGKWGAIQIIARYAQLHVEQAAFDTGFAAATASQQARQFTIGADWYPVGYVKYYLTYERTTFAGGTTPRPTENAIIFRTQLAF